MAEITTYLTVHDGRAAIDFYVAAFGATETLRYTDDNGRTATPRSPSTGHG